MLYYDRTDVSERTDVNNIATSKKYDICYYWYFLNKRFKFQTYVCNRCHDLLMMPMNLGNIAIVKIKNVVYGCIITGISKDEAIKLFQNIDLIEKAKLYKNLISIEIFETVNLLQILI